MRQVVVMVLPYGEPDTNTRTPLEYAGYMQYLRTAAQVIADLGSHAETVIIPSVESQAVAPVLQRLLAERECDPVFFIETKSTTTPGGIALGWQSFEKGAVIPTKDLELLILCDQAREGKVRALAKRLLPHKAAEVLGIHRPDISLKSNRLFQAVETWALLLFPPLLQRRLR